MHFNTPKTYNKQKGDEKLAFFYDPINQVPYYMDDGSNRTQSKRSNNEYDGSHGSNDRMRYFDDDWDR